MKLFQMVTLESPIKLTPEARVQLNRWTTKIDPQTLTHFAKESWEGLMIGLSLGKKGDDPYFVDFCERDLNS